MKKLLLLTFLLLPILCVAEEKQLIGEINNPYDDGKICILELDRYPTTTELQALKVNAYYDKQGREIPIDKIVFSAVYQPEHIIQLYKNLEDLELMGSCDSLSECADAVDRYCEDHGGGQSSELSPKDDCQGRCEDGTEVIIVCG